MRPTSSATLTRRYAPAQRVAWLLTLSAGDWRWRGATLPASVGQESFPPRLAAVERWREQLPDGEAPGGRAHSQAEVRVLDCPGDDTSLCGQLAVQPPIGIEATLQLAWLGTGALAQEDAVTLLHGRVAAWQVEGLGVRLKLVDELEAQGTRRVGRLLRAPMINLPDSPSLGQPLPWIFGRVESAELLPLTVGVTSRLAQAVTAEATILSVVDLADFPMQGRVQLGAELIDYDDMNGELGWLGSAILPLRRGAEAATQPKGTTVRLVPEGGFQWLVADHPCKAVETLYADGLPVDPALWSSTTIQMDAWAAQIITLAQWPLNEEGREATSLTATVQGWMNEAGELVENPARVIEQLLTHERLAGLMLWQVDQASIASAASHMDAHGYQFARRLSGTETLGDLLASAAQEAGIWIGSGMPVALIVPDPTPRPDQTQEELDEAKSLPPLAPAEVSAPNGFLAPDAIELVSTHGRAPGRGRRSYQFPPESAGRGRIPRRFLMDWLTMSADRAAGDMGELLWTRLGEPPFSLTQDFPLGAALLRAGETVRVNAAHLDLSEALAWVTAIEAGPGARARLTLRGPWAGSYCWKLDLENFIRRYSFGGQMSLVVNGYAVARLSRTGTLRLAGRLRERATFSAGPFAAPVTLNGGWLYLSHGAGGCFTPFLRLDMLGNAELTGTVQERSLRAIDPAGQALGAEAARFWLSPDTRAGAFEFAADSGILHLKGIVIESVRL